jgi:hypothetical protein
MESELGKLIREKVEVQRRASIDDASPAEWAESAEAFFGGGLRITGAVEKYNPLKTQVQGSHYKDLKIQPLEYIHANGIPFAEGNVIKYVTRWRAKGGIKDLEKAKHFLELLIELESKK